MDETTTTPVMPEETPVAEPAAPEVTPEPAAETPAAE